jgi:uncharacterized protein
MTELSFTWDPQKNESNKAKHGISFEEAQTSFYDENGRLIFDPDHSEAEERFILLGISSSMHLLVISHTYRKDESEIRIISARRATKNEQRQYNGYLP